MTQFKQCRYCKQTINKRAKVCPHCLRNLGTSPGNVILALIIVLVGFFIIGRVAEGYLSAKEHDEVKKPIQNPSTKRNVHRSHIRSLPVIRI